MKRHINKYAYGLLLLAGMSLTSCDDAADEITNFDLDRVLTPYDLKSELQNISELKLTWASIEGAEGYVVEIYTDSMAFQPENLLFTDQVLTNEYQNKTVLAGSTRYSVRVQSVSTSKNSSKWNGITFKTAYKSAFLARQEGDITHNSAIFRWSPSVNATHLALTSEDGSGINRTLPSEEITLGISQFNDLSENTKYTATLYSGSTVVGSTEITTLLNIGDAIVINNKEELVAKIAAANDGDIFFLMGGTYELDATLEINKSISITGSESDMPIIVGSFDLFNVNKVEFSYLEMSGKMADGSLRDYAFGFIEKDMPYGDIIMEGMKITNYGKSFISAGSTFKTSVSSLVINNSIVGDIPGSGNASIDVRNGLIEKITITNSTLYNLANNLDFIRMDNQFKSPTGAACVAVINNCTIDRVNMGEKNTFFYIRYTPSSFSISNTIISNMGTAKMLSSSSATITGQNNNYYEAPNFLKQDNGNTSEFNPEYVDATNGNFKIMSGSVLVGDPRWLVATKAK